MEPVSGATYVIRLCSGELRRWRVRGRRCAWIRLGGSTRRPASAFSDASLMYAWEIVELADDG